MLRVQAGTTERYCDGMSRRSFVQVGVAGMATAGLAQVLKAKEDSAAQGSARKEHVRHPDLARRRSRPHGHVRHEAGSPGRVSRASGMPIKTNVAGFEITELFPLQAKYADKFSIVRSLHHDNGDHFAGGHLMLTGRPGASGARHARQISVHRLRGDDADRPAASPACRPTSPCRMP